MKHGTTAASGPGKPAEDNAAGTGTPKKRDRKGELLARAHKAGIQNPEKMPVAKLREQLKQLKKEGKLEDGRKNNGGHEESGRHTTETVITEKGLHIVLDKHANETVKVTITDQKSGLKTHIEKPRIVVALEKLFERATKGDGETQALEKWLDRALGKAPQSVAMKHSGEVGTYTAKRPSKAALAAKRAYERAQYTGEAA